MQDEEKAVRRIGYNGIGENGMCNFMIRSGAALAQHSGYGQPRTDNLLLTVIIIQNISLIGAKQDTFPSAATVWAYVLEWVIALHVYPLNSLTTSAVVLPSLIALNALI